MAENLFESHSISNNCQISAANNTATFGNGRVGAILI